MSELRKDAVIGRWVVIASERSFRPSDFCVSHGKEELDAFCPFCPGNENKTPPEIFAIRDGSDPNSPGWSVRVVPNKFPALGVEGELDKKGVGMFDMMNGIGAHEVIIENPAHKNDENGPMDMKDFTVEQISQIIWAYQVRSIDLRRDPRLRYILVFKNHGRDAGASLSHPHSQLIATPVVPKRVKEKLVSCRWYYEYKERCVWCDIITQETDSGKRVVMQNEDFAAIAPFASRFPFEISVYPLRHSPDFDAITEKERQSLAEIMSSIFRRFSKGLNNPSYNFMIYTAPCRYKRPGYWETIDKDFHWHIEIIPRLVNHGGFEWGTGFYINPTPPEEAAEFLRSA